MREISVSDFAHELASVPLSFFGSQDMENFVKTTKIKLETLEPYLLFDNGTYTRNLIFGNENFEMMALCWDKGQCSMIHDHDGQNCWMLMQMGKLRVKNYRLQTSDETEILPCGIEYTTTFDLETENAAYVPDDEPVHQISNLPQFGERAVSLHIYSKPITACRIFYPQRNEILRKNLIYTTVEGKRI